MGGAAAEGGSHFRSRVAAWAVAHGLADIDLPGLGLPRGQGIPSAVALETDDPVDDLRIDLRSGGQVFIQAKRSLKLSTNPQSEFASAIAQFKSAVRNQELCPARDRLVIAAYDVSGPIRYLGVALDRLRAEQAGGLPAVESEPVGRLRGMLADLTEEQQEVLLSLTTILLPNVECDGLRDAGVAEQLLDGRVVERGQGRTAWYALVRGALDMARRRQGRSINGWTNMLQEAGLTLVVDPDGSAAAQHEARRELIEELMRESRARCMVSLQAAGLTDAMAKDLAEDAGTAELAGILGKAKVGQVLMIMGEPGAGKSMVAERLFQRRLLSFSESMGQPIPVRLIASQIAAPLRVAVEDAAGQLGDPSRQGAFIVIDGIGETGSPDWHETQDEAKILCARWPETIVIMTTRPLSPPALSNDQGANDHDTYVLPRLTETESLSLIGDVAGRAIRDIETYRWPAALRDAISLPLFALILGVTLRERRGVLPATRSELFDSLMEKSARAWRGGPPEVRSALEGIARLSTDRGGAPVLLSEMANLDIHAAARSRLAVRDSQSIRITLPILAEWFAAGSLGQGRPSIAELLQDAERLERWRNPLAIFVGVYDHDTVYEYLAPLVRERPGFAAQVISEGIGQSLVDRDSSALPTTAECGRRMMDAADAWTIALRPASGFLDFAGDDGRPRPLGVRALGNSLETTWYQGEDLPPAEVIDLGTHPIWEPDRNWEKNVVFSPAPASGWAWKAMLDQVSAALSSLLRTGGLVVGAASLSGEGAWAAALKIMGLGSHYSYRIPLDEIEQHFEQIPKEQLIFRTQDGLYDLAALRAEVDRLRAAGVSNLQPPWPTQDQPMGSSIWDGFSPDRLMERAQAIHEAALTAYVAILNRWFPNLKSDMGAAVLMPARFKGWITPPSPGDNKSRPGITWLFEPLPIDSPTEVQLQLEEDGMPDHVSLLGDLRERVSQLRPYALSAPRPAVTSSILRVYGASPASDLVMSWLWEDLRFLGLCEDA